MARSLPAHTASSIAERDQIVMLQMRLFLFGRDLVTPCRSYFQRNMPRPNGGKSPRRQGRFLEFRNES